MKKIIHKLYFICGMLLCKICLFWWIIRDFVNPPKTDSVLFVAHPDDDTLFFHSFIKENKPYVCLMTTGYSLRRMPCFFKVMKQYGVRYRAYPLKSRDARVNLLEKHVKNVLKITDFNIVATHNANGEYGHEEHIRVHNAVVRICGNNNKTILCPADRSEIKRYPISEDIIEEKRGIFKKLYVTEAWVLDEEEAGTPVWVTHEHLEKQ